MSLTIDSHPKVPHCLLEIWKKNGGKKANSRKEIRRMTRHFMPPRSSTIQQRLCLKPCAMLSGSDILSPWLFNFATAKLPVEKAANKSNCCDYSINSTQIRIFQFFLCRLVQLEQRFWRPPKLCGLRRSNPRPVYSSRGA